MSFTTQKGTSKKSGLCRLQASADMSIYGAEANHRSLQALLAEFSQALSTRIRDQPDDHPLRALSSGFIEIVGSSHDLYEKGPPLVARVFDSFPEFAPTFPRQLLWFFGGECLHYMAYEEIDQFQQLEEMRLAAAERGETFNLAQARSSLLNLH